MKSNAQHIKNNIFISLWAILGVCGILLHAITNLWSIAIEPLIQQDLNTLQWIMYFGWIVFMLYTEGYRGFQKAFSPRVVQRAWTLHSKSPIIHIILAPLYSMGYFYATKKRKIVSWCITFAIIAVVLFVKILPYPYRNIVDGGVVLGLSYGFLTIAVMGIQALQGKLPNVDPDLPIPVIEADSSS